MTDTALVSVILPFRNAQQTLKDAISSILNQSYTNLELVLIDNASKDQSSLIARDFAQKDHRVKYLQESKVGVVYAANCGMKNANGKLIARMDADDFSFPDRIEKQVDLMISNPDLGLVAGQVEYVGEGLTEGFARYVDWSNQICSPEEIYLNQFVEMPIVNPTIMFRKELIRDFGLLGDGEFPEDYEFFLRLQDHGVLMQKLEEPVLKWRDSTQRLTRTDARYSTEAFFAVKARYLAKWLEHHNPNHPEVAVWGSGKAIDRSGILAQFGVEVSKFIDVKHRRSERMVHYQDFEAYKDQFILSYVSSWDAREEVRAFLNQQGLLEGTNYLICA